MPAVRLTLLIGGYAHRWHLGGPARPVSDVVREWRAAGEAVMSLPHPSWRNTAWLRRNPWFEAELVPELPLYSITKLDAIPATLEGFTGNPTNTGVFWNVHEWTVR